MSLIVAYVRLVKRNAIVNKIIFCQGIKEKTRAEEVFDLVNAFFRKNSI